MKPWRILALLVIVLPAIVSAQQDDILNDVLKDAKPTSRPAPLGSPDAPTTTTTSPATGARDSLVPGATAAEAPQRARPGTLILNNGTTIKGLVWTTRETPLRIYQDATKTYRDIDLALVQKLEVVVDEALMEDDWRWLKEGSDQKVFSGKKYPNVTLHYKVTLANGQIVEGPVVAPLFITDAQRVRAFILFKKHKGELSQTLKDLVYIRSLTLAPPNVSSPATEMEARGTLHLPLIED